jgi:hypothetical protein
MANRVRDLIQQRRSLPKIITEDNITQTSTLHDSAPNLHFPVNGLVDRLPLQALTKIKQHEGVTLRRQILW